MLDCHCHLDRYPKPQDVAAKAASHGVFVVAMTNLPSHFAQGLPHVRQFKQVRLALGLHPLAANAHEKQLAEFERLFSLTSFIGEVGLDFSREGRATAETQVRTFRCVLGRVSQTPKFLSIHSRRAESAVLDLLTEYRITHAVFHWYSGSVSVLKQALAAGHFFSVNPAMTQSQRGQRILAELPPERVLTETDGPYVDVGGSPACPWDVGITETFLGRYWGRSPAEVRSLIWNNFRSITDSLRPVEREI